MQTITKNSCLGGSMAGPRLLELQAIAKNFGGVHALAGVSLGIAPGEVVALVGHNGAGKSVLVQILSGVFQPTSGEIFIDGKRQVLPNPVTARALGIETIYQTLALADNLDAPSNFFLGRELRKSFGFLDKKVMAQQTAVALARLNPNFKDIERPVRDMSGGQRQAIAIARASHFDVRLLIMDEPTAALGPHETEQVENLIRNLKGRGIAILLVSHDVRSVIDLADRIVILKNGSKVGEVDAASATEDSVVDMIVRGSARETPAS
jgi:D-xylose transport system ATP-binding protein